MSISEELDLLVVPETDGAPEMRLAATWLRRAYRRGCNYQFTVPANDQDIDTLNREIFVAMIAYAKDQKC
jgi:hypothetical protein